MSNNELKTLQDFYTIHDKLCVVLKKDTINYDLGLLWKAGVGSKVFLVIAKDPDDNGKHASSTAIVDLLEEKDVPPLFKYEIADIVANTIGNSFIVSKKSNFKDFIMQFNNAKLNKIINPLILQEKLENTLGSTSKNTKKIKV